MSPPAVKAGRGLSRLPLPPHLVELLRLAAVIFAGVIMQSVVAPRVSVLGVTPDLFVILVVLIALRRGAFTGAVFGFCVGLVADVVFLEPIGLRALIYLGSGYAVGRLAEEFGLESPAAALLTAGLVSLLGQTAYALFEFITGPGRPLLAMFRVQVLPGAVLDALVAAPLYLALVKLHVLPSARASRPVLPS